MPAVKLALTASESLFISGHEDLRIMSMKCL